MGLDPQLLASLGMGVMSAGRYGGNLGEGLMQGMQNYYASKQAQQNLAIGSFQLQRQRALAGAADSLYNSPQQAPPMPSPQQQSSPTVAPPSDVYGGGQLPPLAQQYVPPSPQAASAQLPSWLTPPSQSDISSVPLYGGMNPQAALRLQVMGGKDPIAAQKELRDQQLAIEQQRYAPGLAKLSTVIKSGTPTQFVNADDGLKQAWTTLAPQYGFDAKRDYNDENVRMAFTFAHNALASSIGKEPIAPIVRDQQIAGPLGQQLSRNPLTGEIKQEVPQQAVGNYLTPTGPRAVTHAEAVANGYRPYNQWAATADEMQGPVGALDAALTTAGVTLSGGGRSGQQYATKLKNLIAANPGMSPQDIADQVRTGQIDFNGAKRSTGQLSTLAAATDVQMRQIEKNFDSLAPLVKKNGVPLVNAWINSLQRTLTPGGNAEATAAQGYILAIAGEYAKLRSGATGAAAPAEGEMHTSLAYIRDILTQGGFDGARSAITQEARNKRDSVREGLKAASTPGAATGGRAQPSSLPSGWSIVPVK